MRRLILCAAVLLTAVMTFVWPSNSQAQASGTIHICLKVDKTKCIQTHGPGQQVTIGTSHAANWKLIGTGLAGTNFIVRLQDGSGNCLRGNGSTQVVLIQPCSSSDQHERWIDESTKNSNRIALENYGTRGDFAGTFTSSSGRPVWMRTPKVGFDWGWQLVTS